MTSLYLPTAREGNVFRSVCQSFCAHGRGGSTYRRACLQGSLPPGSLLLGVCIRGVCQPQTPNLVVTSSGGHWSSRYASYWNAFLYCCYFYLTKEQFCFNQWRIWEEGRRREGCPSQSNSFHCHAVFGKNYT